MTAATAALRPALPLFAPLPPWPPSAPDPWAGCLPTLARLPDGGTAWLVGRPDLVRTVATSPRFSREAAVAPGCPHPRQGFEEFAQDSIIGYDGRPHRRLRSLVARALTPRRTEALRPRAAEITGRLLDDLTAGPQPADLVSGFCRPLPVQVICELLGVPEDGAAKFRAWADVVVGDPSRDRDQVIGALAGMDAYITGLMADRLRHPAGDLLSALAAAADSAGIPPSEACTVADALVIGGFESITTVTGLSVLILAEHPAEMAKLRGNPGLIPDAVEELLRYARFAATVPPILPRVTVTDVMLGGVMIPAGERVLPLYYSANRSQRFRSPDRFDIHRDTTGHLAFGAGPHFCPGAALARMELQVALRGLLSRLPGLALAVPGDELRFRPSMGIHSLEQLPVTWNRNERGIR